MTDDEKHIRGALRRLVAQIDTVHHSDQWRAVWRCYHERYGNYWGPEYLKVLEEAREVLKED